MFHLGEIAVLILASVRLVKGELGTVRTAEYDVLRNNTGGPILCATDQPHLVRANTRSLLHCSTSCRENDQCLNFNYKDTASICEHFSGYPFKFIVDPSCRHYAVRPIILF